jgi:hypothetical protein
MVNSAFSQSNKEDKCPKLHFEEWGKMNQSKEKTSEWFKDSKSGMFIHWDLYSIFGGIWKGEKIHGRL